MDKVFVDILSFTDTTIAVMHQGSIYNLPKDAVEEIELAVGMVDPHWLTAENCILDKRDLWILDD